MEIANSLPKISLVVIDYHLLVQKDVTEINKLYKACTELGFFYLKTESQLDADDMFTLAKQVFALPLDTNMEYEMDGNNGVYFGYKPAGSMFTDRKGTPDTIEFWNIKKDEFLVQNGTNFPPVILDAKHKVKDYMLKSHEIVVAILEILSVKLGLDSQALPNLHRLMEPSSDQLRFTRSVMHPTQKDKECVKNVSLGAHTDFGSITILFNHLYGLQILDKHGEWLWVPPRSGHAIINLGDAMVKLSGGRLKSNTHRVVTTPGLTQITDRYSIVYFARPESVVLMKSLMNDDDEDDQNDENVLTAEQWGIKRVKNFQVENYTGENTYEMSRGTEWDRKL